MSNITIEGRSLRDSQLTADENFPQDYKRLLDLYNRAQEHYTKHLEVLRDENIALKEKLNTPTFRFFKWFVTITKA